MSTSLQVGKTFEPPEIKIFHAGDEYFDSALNCLKAAKNEILMESYIFEVDSVGRKFLDELVRAASRGVQVFLLVDAIGSHNLIRNPPLDPDFKKIHFRVFHPLPFQEKWSWARIQKLFFLLKRINNRNHRKVILVDGRIAFIGSCNISDVHSKRAQGALAWRDTHAQFQFQTGDPEFLFLRDGFFEIWRRARLRSALKFTKSMRHQSYWKKPTSQIFRMNSRIHWRFANLHELNKRIVDAEKRVWITNAYFVPQRSLFHALIYAARKGVHVCLCLPKKSDVWLVLQASRVLYEKLLKAGVCIYEYEPSVLHAKTMIIDDNWVAIGSHNLNHRSFFHDLEIQAILTDPKLIQQVEQQWHVDLQNSKALTLSELNKASILNKIICNIIYWFRYWL